ncbi:MAG: putative quinol monooxygenase [Pseudomonadales bacterium]|jgi:quinol monooxygenase YgiN
MIVINAAMQSNADNIEAMKEAIAKMETASLAEEGCRDYCFSQELSNPTKMRITERWETMEALAAHFQTPHMAEFQQAMAANPPEGMELFCYEATEVDMPAR